MRCPHCGSMDDKVIDSRTLANGESTRRRRECLSCGFRFTSYERIEEKPLMITPARPTALARRQWALLSSAFLMLKPGSCLVYSTCSINPEENDGVASRLLRKHGDALRLDRISIDGSEETSLGCLVLPDRAGGSGPIYVFRATKLVG